jgi:uncharacterized protein (DUF58 family)
MLTPSGIGTFLASAALVGLGAGLNYPELVQIGAVGAAAVVLSAGLAWRRPRVGVGVRLPDGAVLDGDTPRLTVTLTNGGRWRCFATLLRMRVGDVPVSIELGGVGAGEQVERDPPLPPLRRGVHPISAATLQYRDPFDFARSDHRVGAPASLWVYPRSAVVPPMPTGGPEDLDGRPLQNATAGGDAFYSLREYAPGDSWRKIHWPSTARKATIMVRHTTIPEETAHAVVLDTNRDAYDDEERFEQAVRVAASVCQATLRAGHSLTVVAASRSVVQSFVDGTGEDGCYGPALRLLAGVRLTHAGIDPRALWSIPPGACLMVVSGRPAPALTGWLSDIGRHLSVGYLVQVLGPAQRPADTPTGARVLTVGGLEDFRTSWQRWS